MENWTNIKNGVEILVNPSQSWRDKNQPKKIPKKTKEQIAKEELLKTSDLQKKIDIIIKYMGLG